MSPYTSNERFLSYLFYQAYFNVLVYQKNKKVPRWGQPACRVYFHRVRTNTTEVFAGWVGVVLFAQCAGPLCPSYWAKRATLRANLLGLQLK